MNSINLRSPPFKRPEGFLPKMRPSPTRRRPWVGRSRNTPEKHQLFNRQPALGANCPLASSFLFLPENQPAAQATCQADFLFRNWIDLVAGSLGSSISPNSRMLPETRYSPVKSLQSRLPLKRLAGQSPIAQVGGPTIGGKDGGLQLLVGQVEPSGMGVVEIGVRALCAAQTRSIETNTIKLG